jgi:hypothetical protein
VASSAGQKAPKKRDKTSQKADRKPQELPQPLLGPQAFQDLTTFRFDSRNQSDRCSGSDGASLEIPPTRTRRDPEM